MSDDTELDYINQLLAYNRLGFLKAECDGGVCHPVQLVVKYAPISAGDVMSRPIDRKKLIKVLLGLYES